MKGTKNKKTEKKSIKKLYQKILSEDKSKHKKREEKLKLLAEKITAEKETAQLYLDIAGVMLVVIGSDQKVKLANKKACQTLGYTEKQIVGSNWFDNFIPGNIRKTVKGVFNELMAGAIKPVEYFENPVLTKSGEEKLIAWHNTILRDKKGKITGTLSSGSDITELKKIEDSLMHSEEKYRSFFTSVPVGWAYCKLVVDDKNKPEDYIFLEVNDAFEKLTNLKKENILDKKATKVIPQIKKTQWIEKFGNVALTGKSIKTETYLEPFNKWYSIYVSCPQKGYFITVLEDINSHKKFEEALRESEEKYRLLNENIPVVVYSALPDKYSTNIFLSGRSKELTGHTPEEFLADTGLWDRIILDEDKPQVWTAVEKHRANKTTLHVEYRITCKNGSVKWIKDMATPVLDEQGKLIRIDGFMEDITERKQAEENLNALNKKLENIIEFLPDATFIIDSDKKIIAWNRAMEETTGVLKKDILGKDHIYAAALFYGKPRQHLIDLLYIDNAEIASKYDFVMKKGDSFYAEVFTPALYNGKGAYVWAIAAPFYDMNGNIIGAIESIRDITDRKQAEEKLQKSEKQLKTLFDISHAGILKINTQKEITFANKRSAQMLGCSQEKLIGKNYLDCIHPSQKDQAGAIAAALINGSIDSIDTERMFIRDDGSAFWGYVSAQRLEEQDGNASIVSIISDITERKNLEEELFQAQKMEAVGQLAGGIAHDFNNILNAIIGFGSLLKMKMKDDDPLQQHVKQILESSDRAAELTHNLLAFSRKEIMNLKPVELNEIISHVENFFRSILAENIELTIKKSKNTLNILADRSRLEQIIINLATNSRDAMPDGGQLFISTGSIYIDRNHIEAHGHGEAGHYAVLSVTDTGTGMSTEIQAKIFDPFFTTKEVNKGTGLGLPMVYGIVKQHKGFINIDSETGKGTCVKIYLPLIQFDKTEKPVPLSHGSLSLHGAETVLLAEDDDYLRNFSEVVLAEFGYNVISVKNGEEAVKKFVENRDKIDICVFDVIMPKKNGTDAFKEIQHIRSDTKILFISGYTSDFISRDKFPEKEFTILPKPFKPEALLTKIRETLDK